MTSNPAPNPKDSMWHLIAYYLRFQRSIRGLTGDQLGRVMGCGKASVSRIENVHEPLDPQQAAKLDNAWNTGGLFALLVWYARLGHTPDWKRQHVEFEQRSSVIRLWELALVPGLFQTEDYARALLLAGGGKDLETDLETRMSRQGILLKDDPVEVSALISESVLLTPVGGREVLKQQLVRLLGLSELPNVSIRVVRFGVGAHPGQDGAFKLLTTDEGDVAFVEAPGGGRLVSGSEVRDYALRYERISRKALPEDDSREVLKRALETMS